ncbi:MAG TPA: acyl carrier protein [Bacteroidia bacterium]|nr:acyl carrier protein [Bacteroidia bacterium]
MEKDTLYEELNKIFRNIFDDQSIVVNENTTALDIEDWDSLSHIQLVVAIEKHFKIRFTTAEISGFKSVGDLYNAVKSKIQ